ncbi:MAG: hypothetical protein MUP90_09585 [Gammaproteobacteria bacterium]|nr:hypothetical protein [Gammaproteobacteria bacterium]
MRDQTLLFWGMVVTMFIVIAGVLTARELIEQYFEKRKRVSARHGSDQGITQ